jgi:pyruvate,orthophosphate dikinase
VKIAVDMVKEKLLTREEALMRLEPQQIDQLLHPVIDPKAKLDVIARGLPASPGAAAGAVVFHANRAVEWAMEGKAVILVRKETSPDDIHGMDVARGILTAKGGMTSHAAVVARQMGKTCVAGCETIEVDEATSRFMVGGRVVREGEFLSLNGSTGEVILGQVPLIAPKMTGAFGTLMSWGDSIRRLKVRANADTPRDARTAREFGAQGIGLCRTEHMFFEADRLPTVRRMILSATRATDAKRRRDAGEKLSPEDAATVATFDGALADLETLQADDFAGLFRAMDGLPVVIRLIDPPLHEFLPSHEELIARVTRLRTIRELAPGGELDAADAADLAEAEELLHAVEAMREMNPMLGMRGCRLGLMIPDIIRMQGRAILGAAARVAAEGLTPLPEIMIPLVGHVNELAETRRILEAEVARIVEESGQQVHYKFGTMIEVPRGALTAGQIAEHAEFFSFGTNDLTQMTYGYSRDDAEGKFLLQYVERKILPENPFQVLDREGVGQLVRLATERGRATRPDLKVGICGEHGGDPSSIAFCHEVGLNYVSCSPFRVPVARLAAAQAALASTEVRDR